MAKVYAPNKNYDGVSAGVRFVQGVGECDDPIRLDWFKRKGYKVEEESKAGKKAKAYGKADGQKAEGDGGQQA